MQRVFRPLAVFSIASGASLAAALQLMVGGAAGSEVPGFGASTFFPGYDLAKLELVEPTLYHVDESYVDPTRVDWEQMYVAALDAIERRVPVAMFDREPGGKMVSIEIGEFRTVLEVAPITSRPELQDELRRVATLLKDHLRPEDIPVDDARAGGRGADPFAEIEYALINGMLATLDPHSVLLPPDDAHEMDIENQGEFGGLGITIEVDPHDGRLLISCPLRDTPADHAGLRADDHILRIDGESTINLSLDDAVNRLRGPVGASVDLEIQREDLRDPLTVPIRRELIPINAVQGELLDGGIGYVRISGFHEQVERDLHDRLSKLGRDAGGELEGLILDLRGNPGGFLNQAVKVADTFLTDGDIVSTVDRGGNRADQEKAHQTGEPNYPIVVLVDANSASASEIVAGALRYNERAVIVGERTFGKGSVQNLHPFYDDSKLKLTISKYLTSGDRSLQAVGIPADIELDPALVPTVAGADGELDPVRMFHRERLRREADLDRSLERVTVRVDDPAYRIRYLEAAHEKRRCDDLDLAADQQVQIARDVLKASSGWRRSDVLIAAAPVVARQQRIGNDEITRSLSVRGVDWQDGPAVPRSATYPLDRALDVALDLGPDGRLVAGQRETIGLVVTNHSSVPMYRVAAVLRDNELLEGREFFFGYLPPNATRRYEQVVELQEGWPGERSTVAIDLRDAGEGSLGTVDADVAIEAKPLPAFAWQWSVDDARKGDGDGILDLGEVVDVSLEVRNTGDGPSSELFARLRNRSRTAIDLLAGTLAPGRAVHTSGEACADAADGSLPADCHRSLAAGETWTGTFELQIRSPAPGVAADGAPLEIELSLGDSAAFDQATVVRSGFYEWFGQRETITLTPNQALPRSELRQPPTIAITRAPEVRLDGGRTTVSGVVTDDRGLSHVMVYVGDDKVFFEGGGPTSALRSLPFTADLTLEPGANVISVLATDDQGFVSSRSVVTAFGGSAIAKANP
ncbi:MAG: S41 family peptidase [Myxococcota bacterium]